MDGRVTGMPNVNQTPEQAARERIDEMLSQSGWVVQDNKKIDFSAGLGVAVREYQTDVGPVDYVLFVDKKPVGVVEAKPEDWGQKITTVEEQSSAYAAARLKWVKNREPLPFVYESTGVLTRFTDGRDPKPRSREVFGFPRPETVQDWRAQPASLRKRLQGLPELDPAGLRACQVNAIEKLEASFKDDRPRALIQRVGGLELPRRRPIHPHGRFRERASRQPPPLQPPNRRVSQGARSGRRQVNRSTQDPAGHAGKRLPGPGL